MYATAKCMLLSEKFYFSTGVEPQLSAYDVHAVSSALKLYLRELPIPLISYEAYDLCLIATSELYSWLEHL